MTGRGARPREVVAFWRAAGHSRWFAKSEAFDRLCRTRFLPAHAAAAVGALDGWARSPVGVLALLILLDQLPRNMYRGRSRTWATDPQALALAERALSAGQDRRIAKPMRQFFHLPFMHAEDRAAQERSVRIYEREGDETARGFARHHRDIVLRFGRFPHRNTLLGRESSPAEIAFLATDPFRG